MIPGGFERVAQATTVWRVEGIPDALALFPHLPADHAVVTNICGAESVGKLNLEILRGKTVYSSGDADEPGQQGAKSFADAVASIASSSLLVPPLYEVVPDHGQDLRDYFQQGGTFADLTNIASQATVIEPPAAATKAESNESSDVAKLQASLKHLVEHTGKRIEVGRDPYETLKEIRDELKKIEATIATEEFPVMTSAELDAADLRTEYLIDGIFAKGQPCIIAASKKSLKTTIAIEMTLSLASGNKFLNKFYVPRPVRVALMSGESGDAVIQETARRIAKSKPWINLSDYENALWSFSLPKIGQPQTKKTLTKLIRDNNIEVLIIDPAYLCLELGDDAGNLFSVGPKLLELSEVGRDTGCTPVIIHHNRKGNSQNPFAPPELESIAWSGFQEWARQWILLGRREAYNPEKAGTHKLWLSVGGSAGHSGLWGMDVEEGSIKDERGRKWEVTVDVASAVISDSIEQRETAKEERARLKKEKQVAADSVKLLREIQKYPDGESERHFRDKLGISGDRSSAASDRLLSEGKIEACEIVKNHRTFNGLRPAKQPSGLTGTDRDLTGTNPACPDESTGTGTAPYKGCPDPTHRGHQESLFEGQKKTGPSVAEVQSV